MNRNNNNGNKRQDRNEYTIDAGLEDKVKTVGNSSGFKSSLSKSKSGRGKTRALQIVTLLEVDAEVLVLEVVLTLTV